MSIIYGKSITALVLTAMIAMTNLFGGFAHTAAETKAETAEVQTVETQPEENRADYEELIKAMKGFANINVYGKALSNWSYSALQEKVMVELPEGEWISCPEESANYNYENTQYNAQSADAAETGFTNEESTTFRNDSYERKTAGFDDGNLSINVTEQKAKGGDAESYIRQRVIFRDATAYTYEDVLKIIGTKADKINGSDAWEYEENFADGSSLTFYQARPMAESTTGFESADPVIRTVTYTDEDTHITLGFGRTSLKEITVTENF